MVNAKTYCSVTVAQTEESHEVIELTPLFQVHATTLTNISWHELLVIAEQVRL